MRLPFYKTAVVVTAALLFLPLAMIVGRYFKTSIGSKHSSILSSAVTTALPSRDQVIHVDPDPEDLDRCQKLKRSLKLKLATGQAPGVYYNVGRKIREVVEQSLPNVCVEILLTSGALDNFDLLREGGADLAFVQNDIVAHGAHEASLPKTVLALTQESVQIVVGPDFRGDTVSALSSHPIAFGGKQSGTHFTTQDILSRLNIVPGPEVPIDKASDAIAVLHERKAHGEFFISGFPNPRVAMLLADPYFKLVAFQTGEIQSILNEQNGDGTRFHTPYSVVTIDEHSYSNQNRPITTVAVTAYLMCKDRSDSQVIREVTGAILSDVASDNSNIRRSLPSIDLSSVLELTRNAEVISPLHDGARSAIGELQFFERHQVALNLGIWLFLLLVALATLGASHFRSARFGFLGITSRAHQSSIRIRRMGWINRRRERLAFHGGTDINAIGAGKTYGRSHRVLRRVLFHRLFWQIVRTVSLVIVVWLMASFVMYFCERSVNVNFANLRLSSLSILVYLFSGLEDRAPVTPEGWIGAVATLLSGLLLVAYITGQFASELFQSTTEVVGMNSNAANGGFFIVGWNTRAASIVNELFGAFEAGFGEHRIIVLVSEPTVGASTAFFEERGVTFVKGNPSDSAVLERFKINTARAVIFLADDAASDPDAKTALCVLALRSLCKSLQSTAKSGPLVCAEVLDQSKAKLVREAGADEVICHQDYGLGILVQSALGTKVGKVFHQLLSYRSGGCEFYFIEVPESFIDKNFIEAAEQLNHRFRASENPLIVVGLQRGDEVHLNPRIQLSVQENDIFIVIAWDRPTSVRDGSLGSPSLIQRKVASA